jgi:hypothetical protein
MPLPKRKKYGEYNSDGYEIFSSSSGKNQKKKAKNIFYKVTGRETSLKKTNMQVLSFPIKNKKVILKRVYNYYHLNDKFFKRVRRLYEITTDFETEELEYIEYRNLDTNNDNYHGQHTEYSDVRGEDVLLSYDLYGNNINDKNKLANIGNSRIIEDYLYFIEIPEGRSKFDVYLITRNEDDELFTKLKEIYKADFKISNENLSFSNLKAISSLSQKNEKNSIKNIVNVPSEEKKEGGNGKKYHIYNNEKRLIRYDGNTKYILFNRSRIFI